MTRLDVRISVARALSEQDLSVIVKALDPLMQQYGGEVTFCQRLEIDHVAVRSWRGPEQQLAIAEMAE